MALLTLAPSHHGCHLLGLWYVCLFLRTPVSLHYSRELPFIGNSFGLRYREPDP
jgi:hypothetical protein